MAEPRRPVTAGPAGPPDFLSGLLSVGAANVCTLAGGLVSMAILARHLPADAFGAFLLLQVFAVILGRLTSFGLDLAVPRFLTAEPYAATTWALIGSVLAFRVAVVVVAGLLALLVVYPASGLFGIEQRKELLPFLPILFALQSLGGLLTAVLQGLFLFQVSARAHVLSSLAHVLAIVVLVPGLHLGVLAVAWAKVGSLLLGMLVGLLALPLRRLFRWDARLLGKLLRFSLPLQLNDILGYAALRLDAVLVAALLGPAELVYLEVARRLPEGVSTIYDAFRSVFFPFASRFAAAGHRHGMTLLLNRSLRLLSFLTLLAALVSLLYGPEIIQLLFSPAYRASAPLFALLMLALAFTVMEHTMGYSLVAIGEPGKPVILNGVRSSLNLAANWFLIPIVGLLGPGVAQVLSAGLTLPLPVRFLARRGIGVRVPALLAPALVFAICAGLHHAIGAAVSRPGILLLFGAASLVLGVISLDDVRFWRDSRRWPQAPPEHAPLAGAAGREETPGRLAELDPAVPEGGRR